MVGRIERELELNLRCLVLRLFRCHTSTPDECEPALPGRSRAAGGTLALEGKTYI